MKALRQRVEGQRNQLSAIVDAIGEALGLFSGIMHEEQGAMSIADRGSTRRTSFARASRFSSATR